MGARHSSFSLEELEDYEKLTYFSQNEILHCFDRFRHLDAVAIDKDRNTKVLKRKILGLPELKVNPFRDRICKVFSTSEDGDLTFDDFLDMMSVFSENAPKSVKVEYAFRIYDFNEDGFICANDIKRVIQRLCGPNKLDSTSLDLIADRIMEKADFDDDKQLSFIEFESVISKSPDFLNSFRINI